MITHNEQARLAGNWSTRFNREFPQGYPKMASEEQREQYAHLRGGGGNNPPCGFIEPKVRRARRRRTG